MEFVITRRCGQFRSHGIPQNVVQCFHFKVISYELTHLRQSVFQGLEVGQLFEEVSFGPTYEKSQKMGD